MIKNNKIAVVIPCYMVSNNIDKVISKLPKFIDKIYLVDDWAWKTIVREPNTSLLQIIFT